MVPKGQHQQNSQHVQQSGPRSAPSSSSYLHSLLEFFLSLKLFSSLNNSTLASQAGRPRVFNNFMYIIGGFVCCLSLLYLHRVVRDKGENFHLIESYQEQLVENYPRSEKFLQRKQNMVAFQSNNTPSEVKLISNDADITMNEVEDEHEDEVSEFSEDEEKSPFADFFDDPVQTKLSQELISQKIDEAQSNPNFKNDARSNSEIPLAFDPSLSEDQQALVNQKRLQHYDRSCNWDRGSPFDASKTAESRESYNKMLSSMHQLFIDEKYKMLMCSVPKAATSNWQRVFNSLLTDGEKAPEAFVGFRVHKIAHRFDNVVQQRGGDYATELEKILNDPEWTVFINVRHPFTRLISAWRDKFDMRKGSFGYWQKKFGFFIQKKFEKPEYLANKPETHFVSKEAFLDYVSQNPPKYFDHHWKTFSHFCKPCLIRYDYISHAETSNDDGQYILKRAGVDNIVHLPGIYASSPSLKATTIEIFKNVSQETVGRLFERYREDFEVFGYEIDEYLEGGANAGRRRRRRDLRDSEFLVI